MTQAVDAAAAPDVPPSRPRLAARLLRGVGWTLISLAGLIVLYLFWSLVWTNLGTGESQRGFADAWEAAVGPVDAESGTDEATDPSPDDGSVPGEAAGTPLPDEVVAMLRFARAGASTRPVADDPLFVVEGTDRAALMNGPGRYTHSSAPGQPGNFAVAGHRTTYGAPFFRLDELVPGDHIEATGRDGVRHVYEVVGTEIVLPTDTWVVDEDPLGTGRPLLTLTTCHPRFSAAERMIVFAELIDA